MDFDTIHNWIESYGLIILFIGNILDHSGIPIFILVAGGTVALGLKNFQSVLFVSFSSVLLGDLIFYFIGRYIKHDNFINILGFNKAKEIALKFELNITQRPVVFILFGRLIAVFGKYVPLFAGLKKFNIIRFLLIDSIGSLIYTILFFYLGFYGSNVFNDDVQFVQKLFIIVGLMIIYIIINKTSLETISDNINLEKPKDFLSSAKSISKKELNQSE